MIDAHCDWFEIVGKTHSLVIASEAKQSSPEAPLWIASSLRS
jgi:hypothetical protein